MEEFADMLWLGGILARHETVVFCTAWSHVRYAVVHYLFGVEATADDTRSAENRLFQNAEAIEKHVQAGEVCLFHICTRLLYTKTKLLTDRIMKQ
jgi:hypothetical protein